MRFPRAETFADNRKRIKKHTIKYRQQKQKPFFFKYYYLIVESPTQPNNFRNEAHN